MTWGLQPCHTLVAHRLTCLSPSWAVVTWQARSWSTAGSRRSTSRPSTSRYQPHPTPTSTYPLACHSRALAPSCGGAARGSGCPLEHHGAAQPAGAGASTGHCLIAISNHQQSRPRTGQRHGMRNLWPVFLAGCRAPPPTLRGCRSTPLSRTRSWTGKRGLGRSKQSSLLVT